MEAIKYVLNVGVATSKERDRAMSSLQTVTEIIGISPIAKYVGQIKLFVVSHH